jgi:hypothetical protein
MTHHITQARYATLSRSGQWVYVQCGACGACYKIPARVWDAERQRREANAAIDAWQVQRHDRYYRQTI